MPTKGIILHVGSVAPTAACAPPSLANTAGAISRKRANVQYNGRIMCFIIYRLSFNCIVSFADNYKYYTIAVFHIILFFEKIWCFYILYCYKNLIVCKLNEKKKKLRKKEGIGRSIENIYYKGTVKVRRDSYEKI